MYFNTSCFKSPEALWMGEGIPKSASGWVFRTSGAIPQALHRSSDNISQGYFIIGL